MVFRDEFRDYGSCPNHDNTNGVNTNEHVLFDIINKNINPHFSTEGPKVMCYQILDDKLDIVNRFIN